MISIHALRVEGDCVRASLLMFIVISIHALRVEGDYLPMRVLQGLLYFYPRPPGGGRHPGVFSFSATVKFLSTPSGWRATSPCDVPLSAVCISIHALRVEGDGVCPVRANIAVRFLSTPSGWRATAKTDKIFVCFCEKGRRICLFKTRKEKNLPVAF